MWYDWTSKNMLQNQESSSFQQDSGISPSWPCQRYDVFPCTKRLFLVMQTVPSFPLLTTTFASIAVPIRCWIDIYAVRTVEVKTENSIDINRKLY
jgi:hypothetical protein